LKPFIFSGERETPREVHAFMPVHEWNTCCEWFYKLDGCTWGWIQNTAN